MKFNQTFIAGTLEEAADYAATRLSQQFALETMAEKGSCSLEEAQNMYELSLRVLKEGSEDLIPENLELPDATDDIDPTAGQDEAVDADVEASESEEDGDLNLDDLEGIILPDSEGNQYIIQGGILVPYEEEDDDGQNGGGPADDGDGDIDPADGTDPKEGEEDLGEGTVVTGDAVITESTGEVSKVDAIEESDFGAHSSIIANLIQNTQFK